jgi:CRISPR system Cascade subunit CasA
MGVFPANAGDFMFNTLTDPIVRVIHSDNIEDQLNLPAVFAALMRDDVASFPALRPHQRHAWHAFLVQLGAMALHKADRANPALDEDDWRALLLGMTTADQADTAWSLVAPLNRPALLQPSIPDGIAGIKNKIRTPDALDVLVTSRNHDIKQAVMIVAKPDDWLFAMISQQTMDGFLGAGNYGISRMNGGFANRPAVGRVPPGGVGTHVRRDMLALLAMRNDIASKHGYRRTDGIGLVWLTPWDGTSALKSSDLDPLYIEICRRVRLVVEDELIFARVGNSKVARILAPPGGVTGDPWAPLRLEKDGTFEVLTPSAAGFDYRRMVDLVFSRRGPPALLQLKAVGDPPEGMRLIARALVRGQGKTEGYHERTVPLSEKQRFLGPTDPAAMIAMERIELAGEMQARVLKPALLSLAQNGPDKIDFKRDDPRIRSFLDEYEHVVDRNFFEELWAEADEDDADTRDRLRMVWVQKLLDHARLIFDQADRAMPKVSHRRWKTTVRAQDVLSSYLRNNEKLKRFFEIAKGTADE